MLLGINVWTQDLRLVYLGPVAWNHGTQTGNAACGSRQSRGSLTSRLNRGLRLPAMGQSRGSSAGQLRGECGTSSALVRRKWVEPRLAALVGPVYIRDRSFKGRYPHSVPNMLKRGILNYQGNKINSPSAGKFRACYININSTNGVANTSIIYMPLQLWRYI